MRVSPFSPIPSFLISHRVVLRGEIYPKLLQFIDSDNYYSVDRLYGLLSSTGMTSFHLFDSSCLTEHDQISSKHAPYSSADWVDMTKLSSFTYTACKTI